MSKDNIIDNSPKPIIDNNINIKYEENYKDYNSYRALDGSYHTSLESLERANIAHTNKSHSQKGDNNKSFIELQKVFLTAMKSFVENSNINKIDFRDWVMGCHLYTWGKNSGFNNEALNTLAGTLLNAQILIINSDDQKWYNQVCAKLNADLTLTEVKRHL